MNGIVVLSSAIHKHSPFARRPLRIAVSIVYWTVAPLLEAEPAGFHFLYTTLDVGFNRPPGQDTQHPENKANEHHELQVFVVVSVPWCFPEETATGLFRTHAQEEEGDGRC